MRRLLARVVVLVLAIAAVCGLMSIPGFREIVGMTALWLWYLTVVLYSVVLWVFLVVLGFILSLL